MNIKHCQEEIKLYGDKIGKEANIAVEEVIYKNNAVGTLVGYYDEALTILSISDYLLNELGYTIEAFTKSTEMSLYNLFSLKDSSFLDKDRFSRIKGEGEGKIYTAGGALITVHLFKEDSVDVDGKPIWIMSVNVDWENENLSLIMEALGSASWYMDCDCKSNITKVYWSAAFRKLLGYRDTIDFPNRLESWADLLHPDDKDIILARLTDAIHDSTNQIKYDVDYRLRMRDGEYQWFRAIAEVTRRADGSALRISGMFVNIDKQKKDALQAGKVDALIQKNASMEHLVRSLTRMVDHFAVCDLKNDYYEYTKISISSEYPLNGKYSEFVKFVSDKFKTLPPLAPLDTLISPQYLRKTLQTDSSILKFEYCTMKEDIFRMANFIPLEWDNGVISSVLWTSTDITTVKKNEIEARKALKDAYHAADRANRAKTEFLSNMSHDIRTPMNAIIGMTAIAGSSIDNPERVLECLGKITSSSRHLLGLINEVLDMARIESGKMTLAEEEFNLSELLDNLLAIVKPGVEKHHHNLEIRINKIKHEDVCGDSLRIQQMVVNIMSNAIKYTPDGGNIVFSIEEKKTNNPRIGCYEFTVEDNGIGMTKEFQKIMFEPFTRADDHRTTKVQGTGLGMAVMKNIVEMMNGTIHVESAPNEGTKIRVTILLKLQEKDIDVIGELQNLPVLVVDDDQMCCESTVAILNEIGILGEWVLNGKAAIDKAFARHEKKDDYFAIIMDWKMPGMDGVETTRRIRKKIGNDVTIIVLTSYDYHEIEEEALAAGVDAFIEKPLFRSRLTSVLKEFTTGKKYMSARNYLDGFKKNDYSDKRILLVEDNDLNREIAVEILKMSKVKIDTAENGREAYEMVESSPENWYDLIFMDVQMPVMDGYEATAAIRSIKGLRSQIPIIAMTANAFAEDVQLAKNAGMNEHIAKPLDFDKLNEIMAKWLSHDEK